MDKCKKILLKHYNMLTRSLRVIAENVDDYKNCTNKLKTVKNTEQLAIHSNNSACNFLRVCRILSRSHI